MNSRIGMRLAAGVIGLMGAVAVSTAVVAAEPIEPTLVSIAEADDSGADDGSDEGDSSESGSSFSGPGFAGSSTTGSSGAVSTGSVENLLPGFLGRLLRGVVTGS